MEFTVTDGGNPLTVASIIVTDTTTGQTFKSVSNTDSITITEDDDGLKDLVLYSVTVTYVIPGTAVEIERSCFTEAPTTKPTESPVTTTTTKQPSKSPTITNDIECGDDLTIPANPSAPIEEITFKFTPDDDEEGMKYEITDENGDPLPVEKITITDKDGNVVKEVTDVSEIDVDRTPENGGIETDEPYTVTITFTSTPNDPSTPPQSSPVTIDKECYSSSPTQKPTLSPTILQDIACEDSSTEGNKTTGDTTTFTFTNGGEFVGMEFTITENGNPLTVTSIVITETDTGNVLKTVTNVDSISVTTTDDNLEDGTEYTVTITYASTSTNVEVSRHCFTEAPTTKPTESPVTSTRRPTTSPTITSGVDCGDELNVDASPTNPIDDFTFDFTTDDDVGFNVVVTFVVVDVVGFAVGDSVSHDVTIVTFCVPSG